MTLENAQKKLADFGQEHLLKYYDTLSDESKSALLAQIEKTDFGMISHIADFGKNDGRGVFSPLAAMQRDEIVRREDEFRTEGIKAIKEGKTAALLLAGGMGTRLGSDNPKGMYDIGETKHVYIFQRIIENLLDVVKETGTWIRLFIMTSEKNNDASVKFLKEHDFFGYREDKISFFTQDMAPACDRNGKIYLEAPDHLSTSPNGNAGWYSSLLKAGLGHLFKDEGIEWINIFGVDNVLQRICDPAFIGATILADVSVGAKVVRKAAPDERVGVMCLEDGKPSIVEYYELSDEMMNAKDANGDPAYNYGVILNYLFRVSALEAVADDKMPLHVVEKKIPYIDENGDLVKPEAPNGFKFEQLVLDMIHQLDTCLPYEVIREHEFAPIKNATGVDSVETARALCKLNGIVL
ncbi:UDP-N-acetylglucosamine/UDP-N-acetylgalactosaminediphosphorylase [Ruminococcus sp. YE71]|uniref:UTP--glucose-1-phosphate uridylyltransferase n=1 Tax=unclassified Ruminococcus TaxID=2608920 RepID=UPI000887AE95|nr:MULTISPECIES: UDPGP type 1 family protein [unclassified Ruminococcus]SDA13512.1 UDP-N-acetylglucosamine/UDP-N-acetylgalactosaminediphosphorylase [Ruminococcus sp. YE78]SFW19213.1 UDP-N-acetylglucosamine/UDP-N-acetylgalactosaminediphosphorylase [Ruminococcus sp. YE71]